MKKILLGLVALCSVSVFANGTCVVDFKFNLKDRAYDSSLLKKRNVHKIKKLLNSKGYQIKTDSNEFADYVLKVNVNKYYMCGYSASRASFKENISIDTGYSISLAAMNGNTLFSKEASFSRVFLNFPAMKTRIAMMKAIKSLPICED